MEKSKNNLIIKIVVLSVVFGLAAGLVGDLVARVFILENAYNIPFFGEINLTQGDLGGSNVIIKDAKKVVVEHNDQVTGTVESVRSSLVGIFKKNLLTSKVNDFNLGNFYKLESPQAQGLIITSDGWIMTGFKPDSLNYVIITQDKKIYSIDRIVSDPLTPFYFLHVEAKDLPVKKFSSSEDIKNGQSVIAVNWRGEAEVSFIAKKDYRLDGSLEFSDTFSDFIKLTDILGEDFRSSFIFNLGGDVVGISRGAVVEPIFYFNSAIQSLLKYKEIKRPSLGVNYVNLSKLVGAITTASGQGEYRKGALIYKNNQGIAVKSFSPALEAGLQEGDIITSVEGIEIDEKNNLSNIIQSFAVGEEVDIVYLRNGETKRIKVVLGENK